MNALQWLAENITEWPGDEATDIRLLVGVIEFVSDTQSWKDYTLYKFPPPDTDGVGTWYSRQQWSDARSKLTHGDIEPVPTSALNVQEGGSHYKSLKIQPIEYIHANNIPFAEGNVIKYVTRWRTKNGVADLKKARHFIDLLIELEGREHE